MCGVTCSSTPVSMYCDVVVTALRDVADDRLLVDRDPVAGLDRGLLVVERGDVRVGDDLRVAVRVEQVQRRLHAAREVRVVDEVAEPLRRDAQPGSDRARRPWWAAARPG